MLPSRQNSASLHIALLLALTISESIKLHILTKKFFLNIIFQDNNQIFQDISFDILQDWIISPQFSRFSRTGGK